MTRREALRLEALGPISRCLTQALLHPGTFVPLPPTPSVSVTAQLAPPDAPAPARDEDPGEGGRS